MDLDLRAKYVTTVQIPMWMRREIKESGLTINGALIAGWQAIKERKNVNRDMEQLKLDFAAEKRANARLLGRIVKLTGSESVVSADPRVPAFMKDTPSAPPASARGNADKQTQFE